jgi:hypothetical protein
MSGAPKAPPGAPADISDEDAAAVAAMALAIERDNRAVYGPAWAARIAPEEAAFLGLAERWDLYEPEDGG